ncbi:hypothetical protein [Chitinivorax sp. B]|uniref:hypothetical protein n=1 Tax=Chitinivorax sp. B TaxID=2502235 RepID=UPI0010F6F483|nr:hypothetical protein [Chitinivorax sp. B]
MLTFSIPSVTLHIAVFDDIFALHKKTILASAQQYSASAADCLLTTCSTTGIHKINGISAPQAGKRKIAEVTVETFKQTVDNLVSTAASTVVL